MDSRDVLMYRILRGRLDFNRDGLFLYIKEPNPDLLYRSISVYDEYFDKAYSNGVYLKDELYEDLYEKNLYSFHDDVEIEKLKKEMDDLKWQMYKNHFKKREVYYKREQLRQKERMVAELIFKKTQYDQYSCEGAASVAQWTWIIEHSTYFKDTKKRYDWKKLSINNLMSFYEMNTITGKMFREVARHESWRPIWNLGKKTGNLFDRPSSELTKDQLLLCSFSSMYDNVYESSEAPIEDVINDDDLLDGWFIDQRKKTEQYKREKEAEAFTSNSKIANAGEIFIMASNPEEASHIDLYNSPQAAGIKNERLSTLAKKGNVKSDMEFRDVALEMQTEANRVMIEKSKGK